MATYRKCRLIITSNLYVFDPEVGEGINLVVRRDTGAFEVNASVPVGLQHERVVPLAGILGIATLPHGDYVVAITNSSKVGSLQLGPTVHDVHRVERTEIFPIRHRTRLSEDQKREEDTYLQLLASACNHRHMYFSYTWDLTSRMQREMSSNTKEPLWSRAETRFFWNGHLQSKLIALAKQSPEAGRFVLPVICGYVSLATTTVNRKRIQYGLITRKEVYRVGTRYHSRGIDDQGHVSNFAETEQIVCYCEASDRPTHLCSYVQVRGSIPIFWRQKVNAKYTPVLELVNKPNSQSVYTTHMDDQLQTYGENLVLVNLINTRGYELPLGNEFKRLVYAANDKRIRYVHFDFHKECKKMRYERISILVNLIMPQIREHGYFSCRIPADKGQQPEILSLQKGVIRCNCIDCLDRTNVVQSVIAKDRLYTQFQEMGIIAGAPGTEKAQSQSGTAITVDPQGPFEPIFKNMWADNADAISVLYSGTGALKTDYTRTGKRTSAGALQDGYNSCMRYVKNNFLDGRRQDSYDLFLGHYAPEGGKASGARGIVATRGGALSNLNRTHGLVAGTVLGAGIAMTCAYTMAQGTFDVVRYGLLISFLFVTAMATIFNRYGGDLVDLPHLVKLDYVVERERENLKKA